MWLEKKIVNSTVERKRIENAFEKRENEIEKRIAFEIGKMRRALGKRKSKRMRFSSK